VSGFALMIGADGCWPTFARMLHALGGRGGPAETLLRPGLLAGVRPSWPPGAPGPTQPCCSADGEWLLCFDGALVGTDELRAGLCTNDDSDPELVLAAARQWGPQAVTRLRGEFALALVHRPSGAAYLARDPFGAKPLYWSRLDGRLHIASEIKGLVPVGSRIHEVPPGHHGWAHPPDAPQLRPWYTTPPVQGNGDAPAAVRAQLAAAVAGRLPADQPVGVPLAGDLASAVVLLHAVEAHPDCVAFVLGAPDDPALAAAAELATDLGVPLETVRLHPRKIGHEQVREAIRIGELAEYADIEAAVPALALYARVRARGVATVLTADGADELFGDAPAALRRYRLANLGRTGLRRLDRASSVHGISARVPFLDPELVAVAAGLADPGAALREAYAAELNGYRFTPSGATLRARTRRFRMVFSRLHRSFGYDLCEPAQRDLDTVLAGCDNDLSRALAERAARPDHTLAEHARELAHTMRLRTTTRTH
jgi:asparagine synthase (glutamine-hydrolysing)